MKTLTKFFIYFLATTSFIYLLPGCSGNKEKKQAAPQQGNANRQMPIRADAFLVTKVTLTDKIDIPGTLVANEAT